MYQALPHCRQEQPCDSLIGRSQFFLPAAQVMASLVNASFASPLAHVDLKLPIGRDDGSFLAVVYDGFNVWTSVLTLFLALVAYDQSAQDTPDCAPM